MEPTPLWIQPAPLRIQPAPLRIQPAPLRDLQVELYRKAKQHAEAAKLLSKLAKAAGASRTNPLRAKKLYVVAAMEAEKLRRKMLATPQAGAQTAAQTLDSLVEQDRASGSDRSLEMSWKGAEAYHFLLLAQVAGPSLAPCDRPTSPCEHRTHTRTPPSPTGTGQPTSLEPP